MLRTAPLQTKRFHHRLMLPSCQQRSPSGCKKFVHCEEYDDDEEEEDKDRDRDEEYENEDHNSHELTWVLFDPPLCLSVYLSASLCPRSVGLLVSLPAGYYRVGWS